MYTNKLGMNIRKLNDIPYIVNGLRNSVIKFPIRQTDVKYLVAAIGASGWRALIMFVMGNDRRGTSRWPRLEESMGRIDR